MSSEPASVSIIIGKDCAVEKRSEHKSAASALQRYSLRYYDVFDVSAFG